MWGSYDDNYEGYCSLDVMLCNLVRRYTKITVFWDVTTYSLVDSGILQLTNRYTTQVK